MAALEAHTDGLPMMRAMVLEFPDDPACTYLDRQYLLGEDLLVAPVFSDEGDVSYYVPDGRWTNLLSGDVVVGPGWQKETHGYMSVPVLVRPNTIIALGDRDDRPDYDYREGITLTAYELQDGCRLTTTVPAPDGTPPSTFRVERDGREVRVIPTHATAPWRFRIAGCDGIASIDGGTARPQPGGSLLTPATDRSPLRIVLPD